MFVIRSLGIFRDMADIDAVRVGSHEGVPVTVHDVCTVTEGFTPRQGIATRDANEDVVEGIVLMRRGENPSVVLDALRLRINELNGRILPKGVAINAFYDRTDLVNTTLKTVFHNLAEGGILVTLVLFLFMLSVRASLIVAAVIPLSLAASFIYLSVRGMSANLLSMGAVDFGIIGASAADHRGGPRGTRGRRGLRWECPPDRRVQDGSSTPQIVQRVDGLTWVSFVAPAVIAGDA